MIEYTEGIYKFYVYILTNKYRTTFYIGVTNNLKKRLGQHKDSIQKKQKTFVARFHLSELIYYETFGWIQQAIAREKELKGWRKEKKLNLIRCSNHKIESLNSFFE
ncbi:GIY-YIG nuclease family protein [Salinimicrobium sp. HB62]|uniref:GIY-YIG nuclease family protein n=1 Tax=Salinimicrobium sp. HB62 TaxID=3077781 RepID=UPI002D7776EE|nr:GIY-YIG nuclease family protein [Salinimicrobium sp. HB62]